MPNKGRSRRKRRQRRHLQTGFSRPLYADGQRGLRRSPGGPQGGAPEAAGGLPPPKKKALDDLGPAQRGARRVWKRLATSTEVI